MFKSFDRKDYLIWSVIVVYTGIIYSTLSVVSSTRKSLTERFGPDIFNTVFWVFGLIAAACLVYLLKRRRGRQLAQSVSALIAVSLVYWYYLSSMRYPIERIHFLEYGLLGALLYTGLNRRCSRQVSFPVSLLLCYMIGLGDEAIQWILPNRVGEIGDSVINLFSGLLGILAIHFMLFSFYPSSKSSPNQIRGLFFTSAAAVVSTFLFILFVHGFGYKIETLDPGIVFSSFSGRTLDRINSALADTPALEKRTMSIYENEARRHLLQREFYFVNDFLIDNGGFYRQYDRSLFENRILEVWYGRFLKTYADRPAGSLITDIDKDVAEKSLDRTVLWPDSVKKFVISRAGRSANSLMKSRVKSTIITSFKIKDLIFYCIVILMFLGYGYLKISRLYNR